jgi:hypothetical protein
MSATWTHSIPASRPVLYLAFELGANQWKLGFSTGLGVAVRLRSMGAGNLTMLLREIELAKKKFKLPDANVAATLPSTDTPITLLLALRRDSTAVP